MIRRSMFCAALLLLPLAGAHAIQITSVSLSTYTLAWENGGLAPGTTVNVQTDGPAQLTVIITEVGTSSTVATLSQVLTVGNSTGVYWTGYWALGQDLGRKDGFYSFDVIASTNGTFSELPINQQLQITSIDIHNLSVQPTQDSNGNVFFPYNLIFNLAKPGNVNITVVNSSGAIVSHVLTNQLLPGEQTVPQSIIPWSGLNDNGQPVPVGSYVINFTATDPTSNDTAIARSRTTIVQNLSSAAGDPQSFFEQNAYIYPNPVRGGLGTFHFQAARDNAVVSLKIYTITGTLVYEQTSASMSAGQVQEWQWTTTNQSGKSVGRGLYYYVLHEKDSQGTLQTVKKLAVIR